MAAYILAPQKTKCLFHIHTIFILLYIITRYEWGESCVHRLYLFNAIQVLYIQLSMYTGMCMCIYWVDDTHSICQYRFFFAFANFSMNRSCCMRRKDIRTTPFSQIQHKAQCGMAHKYIYTQPNERIFTHIHRIRLSRWMAMFYQQNQENKNEEEEWFVFRIAKRCKIYTRAHLIKCNNMVI